MKRFSIVERGYDIDEVNRFIDIVIGRLEKLNTENATYLAKIDKLTEKLQEKNSNINSYDVNKLEKAILAVQETNDKLKAVSREEARITIEEAKNNANAIIHEHTPYKVLDDFFKLPFIIKFPFIQINFSSSKLKNYYLQSNNIILIYINQYSIKQFLIQY